MHVKFAIGVPVSLRRSGQAAEERALTKSLKAIQEDARAAIEFRRRSGKLSDSVRYEINEHSGEVFLDTSIAPYAVDFHEGTGIAGPSGQAIDIRAMGSRALHWVDNGQDFFATRVINPGFEGDPFLTESMEHMGDDVLGFYSRAVDDIVEEEGL